jgi:atypical dual specificity phosphatase
MSQIFPNLWITCGGSAREFDFLRENEITHILNCAEEEPMRYPKYVTAIHIPMTDDEDPLAYNQIIQGAQILAVWMNADANTIVHCKAGISRSVTVVLAWLIIYKNYTYKDAFKFLQTKRNFIYPNDFYRKLLKDLEETCHIKE